MASKLATTRKPGPSKAPPKETTAEARVAAGLTPTSKEKAKAMAMAKAEDSMVIDASMTIDASKMRREIKAKARALVGTIPMLTIRGMARAMTEKPRPRKAKARTT